jgi:hypothetical protein
LRYRLAFKYKYIFFMLAFPSFQNRYSSVRQRYWNWFFRLGLIRVYPCSSPFNIDLLPFNSLNSISVYFGERAAAIVSLCRELGLRSKEASLANARKLLSEALSKNEITVIGGTKGGRKRTIPITSTEQIEALKLAATVQGKDKSMIPSDQSWRSWREGGLRKIREAVQKFLGATGLHDLRAGYACQRYTELTGFNSPLLPGPHADKKTDLNARKIIAEELGHSRTQIMNSYIGGRKYVVV